MQEQLINLKTLHRLVVILLISAIVLLTVTLMY